MQRGARYVAQAAAKRLNRSGVVAYEFDTISVSDGISMGSEGMRASLVSRDWIADSVELVMRAQCYDGLLGIAGCDKSIPGMLMAIVRLDLPAVFAYGGSLAPGRLPDKDISLQDVYEAIGARAQGLISGEQLTAVEKAACPGIGTCAGMFSANTMASIAEALGLTVPGMAAPPAAAADRLRVIRPGCGCIAASREGGHSSVRYPDAQVVRERHGRRLGARWLDQCMPAYAGDRGGGAHRFHSRRHRRDQPPHAAARGHEASRPIHDARAARRRRCAGRDA